MNYVRLEISAVHRYLDAMRLFSLCGKPLEHQPDLELVQIKSWHDVLVACGSLEWETARLRTSGDLSIHVLRQFDSRYGQWGKITSAWSPLIRSTVARHLAPIQSRYQLPEEVAWSAHWGILHGLLRWEYDDCGKPPQFYSRVLDLFERGHFPCGWQGNYPAGRLIVY